MRLRVRLRTILVLVILSSVLMFIYVALLRTVASMNDALGSFYRGGINQGWEQMKTVSPVRAHLGPEEKRREEQ